MGLSQHALGERKGGVSKVERSLNVPEVPFGLWTAVT